MNRNFLHFTVDILLFLLVLGLLLTGLLMAFVVPSGQGGFQVWGRTRHDWGDLHFWIAMSLVSMAALHVLLNWNWVCGVAVKLVHRDAVGAGCWKRTIAGLLIVLLLVGLVTAFLISAEKARVPGRGGDHGGGAAGQGAGPRQFRDGQ